MGICDAHVHLGESGPWQPYMRPTIYVNELVQLFDKCNVEQAIVFPNPNVGDKYPEVNNCVAESVKKHPKRFIGFGRVDPRRDDATKELVRMKNDLGLKGLKLHPIVECFRPDHPFFNKFFQKTNELDSPILFHTGDGFSFPGLISKIAKRYSKLPIILGHVKEGAISTMKECENIYVETSGTLPDFIELSADMDENRILFGSDIPYYRYPTQIAIVEAARISQKTKRKIFYGNFRKLFCQE
ncbi:amidohydrolase family protein [Candidatus Bathyarchaeota archaeon]|nr:amidohydrolase family protein [Candidatus Bathyarchaeota archaeon]